MEGKIIEEYPNAMILITESYRGKMLVSSRDFCFVDQKIYEPDGTIFLPAISVEDARVPPAKPHVRGRLIIAGWILRPAEGGKTNATYMTTTDLAGSVPGFIQTMAAKGQTSLVKNVAKAFTKRYLK